MLQRIPEPFRKVHISHDQLRDAAEAEADAEADAAADADAEADAEAGAFADGGTTTPALAAAA